jgi:hypothetical protein
MRFSVREYLPRGYLDRTRLLLQILAHIRNHSCYGRLCLRTGLSVNKSADGIAAIRENSLRKASFTTTVPADSPDTARSRKVLVLVPKEDRGGSVRCGFRWSKSPVQHGYYKRRWGPSTPRHKRCVTQ